MSKEKKKLYFQHLQNEVLVEVYDLFRINESI